MSVIYMVSRHGLKSKVLFHLTQPHSPRFVECFNSLITFPSLPLFFIHLHGGLNLFAAFLAGAKANLGLNDVS